MTSTAIARAAEHDAAGRHNDAIDELARATQQGDRDATTELAKRLITGDRAPHLPADGTRFLAEAAAAGDPEAALRLATLAALGIHVEQSWPHALGLLAFAAERGSEHARAQLRILARKSDVPTPDGWRDVARGIDIAAWIAPVRGQTLSGDPVVRCYEDFLAPEVCAWLIERARGNLKRALIYDPAHGQDVADEMRTNTAAGFDLMSADVLHVVLQQRMSASIGVPVSQFEGPTVLHYDVGEQITNHYDFVNPDIPNYADEMARRGERIITFLVYLNDDYGGGETEFPSIGVSHKGRRGEGLLFTNALPNGSPDVRMVHAGRPPTSGEKWVATQFIRNRAVLNVRSEHYG